ncbi:MAG: class I SAM-dependent methyltransferase [Actinomycetia bacterium]|nr:class I SAM-dependent methyltransferase [Actinomycetes bacterium]MCH9702032.1 class I SAM-dependent methyltransferase [Actinomycetes bacterium]MCH9759438.1 class I SAM-dependent methyltransferase [Actinomycetes bacterium]
MNTDHLELLVSDRWQEKLETVILPHARNGVRLGDDVLEIGPGPGLTTDLLRNALGRLTAAELDFGLASALARRLAGTNVDVVHADAAALPFDDGQFSAVVSFTMLHHVPTPPLQDRVFAEVARVLRPGGQFVAADSLASADLAALHVGDIYNPVEPHGLADRLNAAGLAEVRVQCFEDHWTVHARKRASAVD